MHDNGTGDPAGAGSLERLWRWLWEDYHYLNVFAPISAAALILARVPGAIPGGPGSPVGVLVGVVFILASAAELLPSVGRGRPWVLRALLATGVLAAVVALVVTGAFYA